MQTKRKGIFKEISLFTPPKNETDPTVLATREDVLKVVGGSKIFTLHRGIQFYDSSIAKDDSITLVEFSFTAKKGELYFLSYAIGGYIIDWEGSALPWRLYASVVLNDKTSEPLFAGTVISSNVAGDNVYFDNYSLPNLPIIADEGENTVKIMMNGTSLSYEATVEGYANIFGTRLIAGGFDNE